MKLERTYVSLKVLGDRFVSMNAFGILRGRYVGKAVVWLHNQVVMQSFQRQSGLCNKT